MNYRLTHIWNPLLNKPGFTVPIFERDNAYAIQETVDYRVFGFAPVEFECTDGLRAVEESIEVCVGDEEVVTFTTVDRQELIGSWRAMAEVLRENAAEYLERPFLLLEIARFLEDPALKKLAFDGLSRLEGYLSPATNLSLWREDEKSPYDRDLDRDVVHVSMAVNGRHVSAEVDPRTLLVQFLRENLRLTGTHVGCDTSQCGTCVVLVDGEAIKSCTALAVSCNGADVTTIEGLAQNGKLHPMQQAFYDCHALQCGFCTPGMIMAAIDLVNREGRNLDEAMIRHGLEGNICRCTGYHNIVKAVAQGAREIAAMPKAAE